MEISVQEVFNKVIYSGLYHEAVCQECGMCSAINFARKAGIITSAEYHAAQYALDEYMQEVGRPSGYLVSALRGATASGEDFLAMYEETRDLYLDWANRPMELPRGAFRAARAQA